MIKIAKEIRALTVECIASIGQGHIGGSLSIVDALTVLYYKHMNIDPSNPKKEGREGNAFFRWQNPQDDYARADQLQDRYRAADE